MLEIGGYGPGLVEIDVEWPLHQVFPEQVGVSGKLLFDIFTRVKAAGGRWNEEDTIQRVIWKILTTILGYQEYDISRTPDPKVYYGKKRLDADMIILKDCILEAKAIKIPLLSMNKADAEFSNAIDQGLCYLDNYDVDYGMITNGWDWYLFKKTLDWDAFDNKQNSKYFGVRFRLDEIVAAGDEVRLSQFISLFNSASTSGLVNQRVTIKGCSHRVLNRNLYEACSDLYFRDFSNSPLKGPGSGFRFLPVNANKWDPNIQS